MDAQVNGIKLILPFPLSANAIWRTAGNRTYSTDKAKDYRARVRWIALAAKVKPMAGPVTVSVTAYRPRKRGDIDNLLKATLDALNGVAYADDSQVIELHALRLDDAANPRIVVTIEPNPSFRI